MMGRREVTMLSAALLSVAGATLRIVRSTTNEAAAPTPAFALVTGWRVIADDSLAEAANSAIENDPFRLANRPSNVRYDALSEEGGPHAPSVPSIRPAFAVKAIMGGPPWQAILDGIPGQPNGTIVRSGATFDKITVKLVGRDTVVVQGPDTLWKLTLRRDHP